MRELTKTYNPNDVETSIYERWEKSGYFNPDKLPKRWWRSGKAGSGLSRTFLVRGSAGKPFSISMPPPNVTGDLHLGHALDLTTQDILIRYRRMRGDTALWIPGTDHAGIATQIMVERLLRESGVSRYQIGRETFLQHVWEWKKKYGERIVEQIKHLGASCDWSRERFTMDPGLTKAVQTAFLKLYDDGLIYRGERVIHWCVDDRTGISDLEVDHREKEGTLWYIRYELADGIGHITIATARPETMLGDTAVAVHPEDKRYRAFVGKSVVLPITGRTVPIIADTEVDPSFGAGAVKVTPAHDAADFEISDRHQLPRISVIGLDARMTKEAGDEFEGLTTLQCRERVVEKLRNIGALKREEPYRHSVAYCSRSNTVIEPLLSKQWFVKMKPLAEKALKTLRSRKIAIVPDRFGNVLIRWLENIRDWNISRQLWWGHRIPIWYCIACDTPVASVKEPRTTCKQCGDNAFRQDEDTLDTWFSSGLWTFSTLGWPEKMRDLKRFHPTSVLGTGWDILFFWVARMIMFSLYFRKEIPFRTVYIHGLVLDERGKKMSKSRGTGINPIPMAAKYGTDAIRLSLIVGTTPSQDFRMSEQKIAGQRNFCNKLWNIARYVLSQRPPTSYKLTATSLSLTDHWILARLKNVAGEVTLHLEKFQFGLAVETIQRFVWTDLADWYVEIHKLEGNTAVLRHVLRQSLVLLHPFAPFITETIWLAFEEKNLLMIEPWSKPRKLATAEKNAIVEFRQFQRLVIGLRNLKIHGAENRDLVVHPKSTISANLLPRLTGVTFAETRGSMVLIAGNAFVTDATVAQRFLAWRARERQRLNDYIKQKHALGNNPRAPEQVRDRARRDAAEAERQLAEFREG